MNWPDVVFGFMIGFVVGLLAMITLVNKTDEREKRKSRPESRGGEG